MNEKLIEKKIREGVKKRGGIAIKFTSPGFTGVPDRLILMPTGRMWFVETKSTGRKLTPRQELVGLQLSDLGFNVKVVDDELSLQKFLSEL
jgi:hypothetical protein